MAPALPPLTTTRVGSTLYFSAFARTQRIAALRSRTAGYPLAHFGFQPLLVAVASAAVTGTLDDLAAAHNLHHLDVTGNAVSGETSSLRHLSNLNHLTLNGKIENKEDLKNACETITVVPFT